MTDHNNREELDILEQIRKKHPGAAPIEPATEMEINTTQNPDQKTELSHELFPHIPRTKRMKTHRVIH
ncbi:MAG: hypothetical protein IKT57_03490 [Clostridia bacterium]|nr:hypothetical protein [Clostridia bacterium]